ncbi:MAG: LysM peptidoglycan-binding domain-containing protein [Chitinophagales bacterium]|nr:LysM peptidoglycan-binding domain-containing protein [Hyphomicrobiales bacterium]
MSKTGNAPQSDRKRGVMRPLILWLLFLFGAAFYLRASGTLDTAIQYVWLPEGLRTLAPAPADKKPMEVVALAPTFDIVRAETSGDMVLAGRAEPGWKVRVESGGSVIGETAADANGEWVLMPDKPLAPGDHSLSVRATQPGAGKSLVSGQRVALSISSKDKQAAAVVALTEQGKPTRVLQSPAEDSDAQNKLDSFAEAAKRATEAAVTRVNGKSFAQSPQPAAAKMDETRQTASVPLITDVAPSRVEFEALDYEKNGQGGKIFMSGKAAANSRVMLYINDAFAGFATAGPNGAWTFAGANDLPSGTHRMRADQVDIATGKVLARAEVSFEREKIEYAASEAQKLNAPPTPKAAQLDPALPQLPKAPFEATVADMSRKQSPAAAQLGPPKNAVAALLPSNGAARLPSISGRRKKLAARRKCKGVTVQRGDTLWHIARRCYGVGDRYSKIFRSNQGQIRDPDRIYPSQRFVVPR